MSKPSLARGTRDFGPEIMVKRTFIFDQIKEVYQKYGFLPLETPAIENLSVLMGKYGEEGDQLLFKILNSGDFAKDITNDDLEKGSKEILRKISEKGLKYDLTVPFARYVVMNRHQLAMPFKRFQIQPVWRADRPQKGRYREFYQCDADVVGTDSLICEAEIVTMLHEIFENLGVSEFVIKINNRKILSGITESIGAKGKEVDLCVAIDKLDKIGQEKVEEELLQRGFDAENISKLKPIFNLPSSQTEMFSTLKDWLKESETGLLGVQELEEIWTLIGQMQLENPKIAFDPSLARGLSYYTGAIFEVKALNVSIGSISGGGRYDNLTGTFGMPGLSGVGISLGVDRIYDVMEELGIFPEQLQLSSTKVMVTNFGEETLAKSLETVALLRRNGVNSEIYPENSKIKKQFEYADKKKIPYVLILGSDEIVKGIYLLKNMKTGEQKEFTINQLKEFTDV
ncbi:MAG TPA: histidine--tRNA ligase [Leadbetterella sp.]|nr:histidine--tRNA ligase [Leadbetterella sp.]